MTLLLLRQYLESRCIKNKMYKKIVVILLLLYPLTSVADWELKYARWLGENYITLFQKGDDSKAGFFLTSKNVNSIIVKLLLESKTITKDEKSPPFIIKGDLFFDGEKYATYQIKNSVAVHDFEGQEYEFDEDIFDAEFYEKLKYSKQLSFKYKGLNNKRHQVVVTLKDYYTKFNQFITYRMKEFIPEFSSKSQKKKFERMIEGCVHTAELKVEDIHQKNKGVSLAERKKQVILANKKLKEPSNEKILTSRVDAAYLYYGDLTQPDWLLYPLFSECYNSFVHEFN